MPQDVGYNFLPFEVDQITVELADMLGLPPTPENILSLKQAVQTNPALGANSPTGRQVAAEQTDPYTKSDRAGYPGTDFVVPGADDALQAYKQSLSQPPDAASAPIESPFSMEILPNESESKTTPASKPNLVGNPKKDGSAINDKTASGPAQAPNKQAFSTEILPNTPQEIPVSVSNSQESSGGGILDYIMPMLSSLYSSAINHTMPYH